MKRINVLILLLVVLIVAGLGVTVVYRVRDVANAIKCQNNLHQIGIALQGYHDATGHFPSATVRNAVLPPEKRLSWTPELWPCFMEGGYRSLLNPKEAWDSKENYPDRCLVRIDDRGNMREESIGEMPSFRCPGNPNSDSSDTVSPTDYVGIAGVGEAAAKLPLFDPRAGFFGYDRQITFKDIKDGTANTMAVTEVLDGGPWTAGGYATVRGLAADARPYLGKGGQFTPLHLETNVLFADASVRSFTSALPREVFEAMATIAGGEKADAD
jgi:hypothetical protein